MVLGSEISHWLAVFGAPGIFVAGEDIVFIMGIFRDFSSPNSIVLQTVIPGHHQCPGEADVETDIFRTIVDHIIGNRTSKWPAQRIGKNSRH